MMHYADLILPVPLSGLFTYAVPEGMSVRVGARVLVTFGRSKTYIGGLSGEADYAGGGRRAYRDGTAVAAVELD